MFKSLIVSFFLQKEVNALKIRLAEASDALKRIETVVVSIDKESSRETQQIASKVLQKVLSSADQVRTRDSGFVHDWEEAAYATYNQAKQGQLSTLVYAHELIDKTKVLFKK
jgi:hypothetical protein